MRHLPWHTGMLLVQILCVLSLRAEDKIYLRGSNQPTVGTIEKADDTSVTVKFPQGSTQIQRVKIERVEIAKPATLATGLKAVESSRMVEAIQVLEPIYIKYRGLPESWIEETSIRLGEAYVGAKEWAKARNLFVGFRRFYPTSVFQDIALSGEANALFNLKQTDEALKILEGMVKERIKEVSVSDEQNRSLGTAHVTLGRCYLAAQKNEEALEAFLKTIVLYYLDGNAVAEAQYESALLFEKMKNPGRAKRQLEDLLKEFPNTPIVAEARKKLDSFGAVP